METKGATEDDADQRKKQEIVRNADSSNSKKTGKVHGNRDEPMDLTFSNKPGFKAIVMECGIENHHKSACFNISKIIEMGNYVIASNSAKKRGRKRKVDEEESSVVTSRNLVLNNAFNPPRECLQTINSKEAEVLKAAKSLFSKRTQTLYHWLYPNTPKSQLKAAVSVSWDTLGTQEKEFYVSQVLGRFGFPHSSLMVNPQLGSIQSSTLPPLDLTLQRHQQGLIDSKSTVSALLKSEPNCNMGAADEGCMMAKRTGSKLVSKRKPRGRIGRPSKSSKGQIKENDENLIVCQIQNENHDDFQDDPELSREFAQFKWSLNLN